VGSFHNQEKTQTESRSCRNPAVSGRGRNLDSRNNLQQISYLW